MHNHKFRLLKKRWKIIAIFGLLFAIITTGLTFLFPLQYKAEAQVFIISQTREGVDPYTTVKSAERIGENLAQIVTTDDFYQKVIGQDGYGIDKNYFNGLTDRQRRKLWGKTVNGSVVFGTGVFNITAYHEDPSQARRIVAAAANALVTQGWQYVGGDVIIKLVNQPVTTPFPARPNILLNSILGLLIGILLTGFILVRK